MFSALCLCGSLPLPVAMAADQRPEDGGLGAGLLGVVEGLPDVQPILAEPIGGVAADADLVGNEGRLRHRAGIVAQR